MGDVLGTNASVNYRISLYEPSEMYKPGDVISGTFDIKTTQVLKFKAINITYCGNAFVHWQEWKTWKTLDHIHFGQEEYFNFTECVRGGSEQSTLLPGTHTILFQHVLPEGIPSSFASEYGCVSYYIRASVEYGDERPEVKVEREFKVIAPLDLNLKEHVQHPMFLDFEEAYGFCIPSALNVQVSLPQTGYCPGQCIPMHVNVENDTTVTVKKIIFQIVRRDYYRCHDSSSCFSPPEQVLTTLKSSPVPSHSRADFVASLLVPHALASAAPNLTDCRIIDVAVYLRVTIKLSGFNDDLTNQAELCIGSTPLLELPIYPDSLPYHMSPPLYPNLNQPYPESPPPYPSAENQQNLGFDNLKFTTAMNPDMSTSNPNSPQSSPRLPVVPNSSQITPSAPPWYD